MAVQWQIILSGKFGLCACVLQPSMGFLSTGRPDATCHLHSINVITDLCRNMVVCISYRGQEECQKTIWVKRWKGLFLSLSAPSPPPNIHLIFSKSTILERRAWSEVFADGQSPILLYFCVVNNVCVHVRVCLCDLRADTVSAWCSCLLKRSQKEEAPTVSTQSVNLHYGLPSHADLQCASTEDSCRDAPLVCWCLSGNETGTEVCGSGRILSVLWAVVEQILRSFTQVKAAMQVCKVHLDYWVSNNCRSIIEKKPILK